MRYLTEEQVELMLEMQGYMVPRVDLHEVTARLNALIEGLNQIDQYGDLREEPWPVSYTSGSLQ